MRAVRTSWRTWGHNLYWLRYCVQGRWAVLADGGWLTSRDRVMVGEGLFLADADCPRVAVL